METYHRGQWGIDEMYPEDYEVNNDRLVYKGYDKDCDFIVGGEYEFCIRVYCSEECNVKYNFFVYAGNCNRFWPYLVTDMPSLLMFIREFQPLIEEGKEQREQQLHEIRLEEHKWKVKGLEEHQYRKNCEHV